MLMKPKNLVKKKDCNLNVSVVKILKLDLVTCEGKEKFKEFGNF